jgi:hypothetical protein
VRPDDELMKTINLLLRQDVFDQVLTGGPFGRDAQFYLARTYPGLAFLFGRETFTDAIQRRQALWDNGHPWTEVWRKCSMRLRRNYSLNWLRSARTANERRLDSYSCLRFRSEHTGIS